jgi:hypothetical protein
LLAYLQALAQENGCPIEPLLAGGLELLASGLGQFSHDEFGAKHCFSVHWALGSSPTGSVVVAPRKKHSPTSVELQGSNPSPSGRKMSDGDSLRLCTSFAGASVDVSGNCCCIANSLLLVNVFELRSRGVSTMC